MLKAAGSVGVVMVLEGDTTAEGAEGTDGPGLEATHVKAAAACAGRAARHPEAVAGSKQGPYGRCRQMRPLKQRLQMSLVDSQTF